MTAAATSTSYAAESSPNIVLVLLDDARLDDVEAMPRVQSRVAAQGATFTSMYSSFPLCCPARATLLTGQYPHNHGVLGNVAPGGGFSKFKDTSTLATWLDPTYRTGLIGKYFNQYKLPYIAPGWDEWMVPKATYNYTGTGWLINNGLGTTSRTIPGYQTDTIGSLAADFIARNTASEPYFLYTSIVAPHAGSPTDPDDRVGFPSPYVKPAYRDAMAGVRNTDPSFNEADVSDKPLRPAPLTATDITGLTETFQQRRESLISAEDALVNILDTVKASGEADNTYIWVMSDNGLIQGEHRLKGGKTAPYEVSNHIPSMVIGPGIPAGSKVTDSTAQVDFAPTVMAMAGLTAPASVDGANQLPALRGGAGSSRAGVVIQATDHQSSTLPLPWIYRGVVADGWKYVERTTGKKELYDLTADPYELQNVAGKAPYAAKQSELAGLNQRLKDCAGVSCR